MLFNVEECSYILEEQSCLLVERGCMLEEWFVQDGCSYMSEEYGYVF